MAKWPFEGYPRLAVNRRAGIYVVALGEGDDHRLGSVFRDTWKRLPLTVRRALLRYWRYVRAANTWPEELPLPFIVARSWNPGLGEGSGVYIQDTESLIFLADAVRAPHEGALAALIAHELGHVYLKASGYSGQPGSEEEAAIEELLKVWRIDEAPLQEWEEERRAQRFSFLR